MTTIVPSHGRSAPKGEQYAACGAAATTGMSDAQLGSVFIGGTAEHRTVSSTFRPQWKGSNEQQCTHFVGERPVSARPARCGRGGAEVRVALDKRLGRTVAIKIMRSDLANDEIFLTRFRREAHSVAQMNNPNIVNIYDSGERDHRQRQRADRAGAVSGDGIRPRGRPCATSSRPTARSASVTPSR